MKGKVVRKVLAIVLSTGMLIGLSGCGDKVGGEKQVAAEPSAAESSVADTGAADGDSANASAEYGMNPEASGKITIWTWGDYEIKGTSDFNKYYPGIEVEYVQFDSTAYVEKVVSTLASGGEMPDVVLFESGPRGQFLSMKDTWEDLSQAPYNADTTQLLDWSLDLMKSPDGKLLCIQVDNCVGGIAYDRSLAKKYFGTDDPDEMSQKFQTIDDFVEAGKTVAAKGDGDMLFSGAGDVSELVKGKMTSEAWVTDGKITMDSNYKVIYEYLDKFMATGAIGQYVEWTSAWQANMSAGKTVFYAAPTWFVPHTIKPNDPDSEGRWGLMTPPGGGFSWGGTAYAIPSKNSDKQKELAWTWIKYFTMSEEGGRNFYEGQQTPSLYKPMYETDLYKGEPDPFFGGQNVTAKYIEISQNPNTASRPLTQYDQAIETIHTQNLIDIGEGKISGAEAFAKLKSELIAAYPELTE